MGVGPDSSLRSERTPQSEVSILSEGVTEPKSSLSLKLRLLSLNCLRFGPLPQWQGGLLYSIRTLPMSSVTWKFGEERFGEKVLAATS